MAKRRGNKKTYPSSQGASFAILNRRVKAAELYLKGMTQSAIAAELKVSVNTISWDLQKVREEWLARAGKAFEERKAEELAKIDQIELMAWRGWEKSIERQEVHRSVKETVRQQVRDSENKVTGHRMVPVKVVDETVVKGQSGDPRFLEMATRCVEMRLRILGLWKGDVNIKNQVTLDWTKLFEVQEKRAEEAASEQQRVRVGLGRGVIEVKAETPQEGDSIPLSQLPLPPGFDDPIEERIRQEELRRGITLEPKSIEEGER